MMRRALVKDPIPLERLTKSVANGLVWAFLPQNAHGG
jgi:hypothetical protein